MKWSPRVNHKFFRINPVINFFVSGLTTFSIEVKSETLEDKALRWAGLKKIKNKKNATFEISGVVST